MRILLTNDDGVQSPGLISLKTVLGEKHEVWVLAPDGERSGTSHRITLKGPILREKLEERTYSCSGTPADCVIIALRGGLPVTPDFVISGINIGPNIGTDVIYSGTAAAARQAAIMGLPGLAVSLDSFTAPFHFEGLSRFVDKNLFFFQDLWRKDHFININAPNLPEYAGVSICRLSRRVYHDKLLEFNAYNDHSYFFIQGFKVETLPEPGTDWDAVSRGCISISPVLLNPANRKEDAPYREARFELP
jgi:5'-nucleotidase